MVPGVVNVQAFVGFLLFTGAVFVFYFLLRRREGFGDFSVGISYKDLYSFILVVVPVTAAMAYLVMSFGYGLVDVVGGFVYWIRYFEWAVTTPLLVLGVMILSQKAEVSVRVMIADFLMIVFGFLAAVSVSTFFIVFFILSFLFFVYIIYVMVGFTGKMFDKRPFAVARVYRRLRNLIVVVWSAYPILFIVGNMGFGFLGFEATNTGFLLLDLSAKIGFAWIVLRSLESVNVLEKALDMDLD